MPYSTNGQQQQQQQQQQHSHGDLHELRDFTDIRVNDEAYSRGNATTEPYSFSAVANDAYPLKARSDASYDGDVVQYTQAKQQHNNQQRGTSVHSEGESVRPDSLALTSPLEQLKRNLSFNRGDSQSGTSSLTSRPLMDRQASLPAMIHALEQDEQATSSHTSSQMPRIARTKSNLDYEETLVTRQAQEGSYTVENDSDVAINTLGDRAHNASHDDTNHVEPVRFSDDTAQTDKDGVIGDNSDARSQLISAFRNSYHTTRDGNFRDSSYSWIGADQESPNNTLDFKQAQAEYRAAGHDEDDEEAFQDSNDDSQQQQYIYNSSNDNSNEHEIEDISGWEAEGRNRVRASSWDSQEAEKMGLHRIPSQRKLPDTGEGRQSNVSHFDPFAYAVS